MINEWLVAGMNAHIWDHTMRMFFFHMNGRMDEDVNCWIPYFVVIIIVIIKF